MDTMNYRAVSDSLSIGAQPTPEQIRTLPDENFDTVIHINVLEAPYSLENEEEVVRSAGLNYHRVDISFENPDLDCFSQLQGLIQSNTKQRIFVHCASGYISSVMMCLHRCLKLNQSTEDLDFFGVWQPNDRWQVFINEVLTAYSPDTVQYDDS